MSYDRILTLVVMTDEKPPQWIYDSHMAGKTGIINGVKVLKISEGDKLAVLDSMYEQVESLENEP